MRIRKHIRSPNGRWCLYCGQACSTDGNFGGATCNEREDGTNAGDLRPEPKRREMAYEDQGTIGARQVALRREAEDARNAVHCAVMNGGTQDSCGQCAGVDCLICNVKRGRAAAECIYCHRPGQTSLPCPSRNKGFNDEFED